MVPLINEKDLNFLLYDVFDAESLNSIPFYQDHDRTTFASVIQTAHRIAQDHFAPHNSKADALEPQFDGKTVSTLPEVKAAWQHFVEAGFLTPRHCYQDGGMQLPALIYSACIGLFVGANPSTASYPFLTSAAANLIDAFGTEQQKQTFLPSLFNGSFAGTMAMTEPDVGSSLGDLTTKAIPQADGSYKIKGQKMYISGGDQDITDNIIHLVLARVEAGPAGVKGISLFIVPKYRVNEQSQPRQDNDVLLAGLLHKMGYRGTTSTALSFGENDNCIGYLIGEEGKGLSYMFKMMNEARIAVGLSGAMIGYRGYLSSLDYAKKRPQGRKPAEKKQNSQPINIIEHADVKRMLLAQKAYVEGSLALCLYASKLVDRYEAGGDKDAGILLDLLTPVVKSFPSYYGPKANDLAIQVLGGAGYIRDYPVEQCYRDNRLNAIHEGTHGIQALDLLGRKLWLHNGKGLQLLLSNVNTTLANARDIAELQGLLQTFQKKLLTLTKTTQVLGHHLQAGKVNETLANSALYLDMLGKMVVAWLWIEMAEKAHSTFSNSNSPEDQAFLCGKQQACKYFIEWELGEIEHQSHLLTSLDNTCSAMEKDWF